MPLPDQTPRLPKWPFVAADAALLVAAWAVADLSARPLGAEAVVAIVVCVAGAALVGVIPFLTDYARKQDEALDDRQRALEALARTTTAAAEQISIAAGGFAEIAELAQKNLKHAEQLPHKLQEKMAEFQARLAQARDEENDELEKELAALRSSESERLESTADKVARAAAEWAKVEASVQKNLAASKAVLAELDQAIARLRAAQAEAAEEKPPRKPKEPAPVKAELSGETQAARAEPAEPKAVPQEPAGEPAAPAAIEPAPEPIPEPEPLKAEAAAPAAAPAEAQEPKLPRKRASKKPKEPAPEQPPKLDEPTLALDETAPPSLEFSQTAADEAEPVDSISADGATRLLVTAYIGIGNRLYVRGEGGGLTWDKGVPLQFVSIGKWRWEAMDATATVTCKLYKNDETECPGLPALKLEPGHQQDVTANF